MNENPYAPPTAPLADVDVDVSLERPKLVVIAVRLLWGSFAVGLVVFARSLFRALTGMASTQVLVTILAGKLVELGLDYWFFTAAWKGKGWSRWVQLVIGIISFGAILLVRKKVPQAFVLPWYIDLATAAANLMLVFGVALLFSPSANAWYRAMKRSR